MINKNEWLIVGLITSCHGINGQVKVKSLSDFEERFLLPGMRWLQKENEPPSGIELISGYKQPGKETFIVKLQGVNSRIQAEQLKKSKILVKTNKLPKLKKGEFHLLELINLEVKTLENNELKIIGKVINLENEKNNLLVIELFKNQKKILIPFVKDIVPLIDIKNNFYLIWIDQLTKALWFQIFKEAESNYRSQNKYLDSVQEPRQLSKSIDGNFDSSFVISENFFLYGICEINNRDYLFSLNLKKTKQDIHRIKKFKNFAGDLSSNTSASLLSWIEWDSPYMPWEKNELFFAQIDQDGEIQKIKKFSNKLINSKKNVSFFQPYWISETHLVCSEDSSGWWNLLFLDVSEIENIFIKKRVERNLIEYGAPQWVTGITFFSGNKKNLFCVAKKENSLIVEQYKDLEFVKEFSTPFTSISDFSVFR